MRVQTKLILLIFLVTLLFTGIFFVQYKMEYKRTFILLSEEKNDREVLLDKVIKLKGALVEMLAVDYSFWDDTVKFLETKDTEWAKQNLETSLDTYKINAIWVYKRDFSPIYSINNIEGLDVKELEFSAAALGKLFEKSRFCHFFLKTSLGLVEVYGATIHPTADTERKTPPQGFLFSGKLWDEDYVSGISGLVDINITVHLDSLAGCAFSISPHKGMIYFSRVIYGLDGTQLAHLDVERHSRYASGFNKTIIWTLAISAAFALIILFVLGTFLSIWIGKPLKSISTALKREDIRHLEELRKSRTEFGEISRLIYKFSLQRKALQDNEELISNELFRFKALFDLALSMSSGKNIDDNLRFIVDRIRSILHGDFSFITLFNKDGTEARIHAESGIRSDAFRKLVMPAGKGMGGLVIKSRKGCIIEDYFTDKAIYHFADPVVAEEGVVSCMAAPIQSKDKDFGVLYVFQRNKRTFSGDDLRTIELFAHLATVEIERAQAFQNLRDTQMQLVQTEKMAAIGQLASGVAHEINNPLTGVLNNVQLIKMEMEAKKDKFTHAELKELLDIVEESSRRCMKITQSLLSFSHASRGEFSRIDFNEMIKQVVFLVEHEMKLGDILIEKELQEGLPSISGDIQLLQQVIFNLISNAKWAIDKRSESKSGTIRIKTGYEADNSRVCVLISDNGVGMSQETLKKIFEPFFTTKPIGEGTGLGLSVSYSIIKEHQGHIEVESAVNQGTTFKLCFPAIK